MLQEALNGVKQQLASREDEIQMQFVIAKMQLATAHTETHVLKERYARQAQELQKKVDEKVTIASLISNLSRVALSIIILVISPLQSWNLLANCKQASQKRVPREMPQAACAEQHPPIRYYQRHSREPTSHI